MTKVSTHVDADGISSAFLLSLGMKNAIEIVFPPEFGLTDISLDIMLDQVPQDPTWEGLCIDHHAGHWKEDVRKYKLEWGDAPTSILVLQKYEAEIPKDQRWKAVVGAVGDMEPERVPVEIWDEFPILRKKLSRFYGWEHKEYANYVYQGISAPINSLCRTGNYQEAYELLMFADSPFDLLEDADAIEAKENIKKEKERAMKDLPLMNLDGYSIGVINIHLGLESILATELSSKRRSTVLIQNMGRGGKFSLRGELTPYVQSKLHKIGIECNGHRRAMGGTFEKNILSVVDKLV